jgi:hypothetical protein
MTELCACCRAELTQAGSIAAGVCLACRLSQEAA